MIGRWILCLLLSASFASGIQRPDTKTTLRSLARLPRVEPKFSLDFSADRGFALFDTSKDPGVAALELRQKINAGAANPESYLELASLRNAAGDLSATRDFQRAADALRKRLDTEPGNARLKIDLATALHGL